MLSEQTIRQFYMVRAYRYDDVNAISQLHKQSILNGFLSKANMRFLNRLYRSIGSSRWSKIFVAENNQARICGYIAGTMDTKRMYRFITVRQGLTLLLLLLPQITTIRFIKNAAETFFYPISHTFRFFLPKDGWVEKRNMIGQTQKISAELLAIAVEKDSRSKGLGRELVKEFEKYIKSKNISAYKVVTEGKNDATNHFYSSCGFQLHRQFIHHGNEMNELIKML
jgi:ribosomal protein S18 acetylase RimI-like enzyme